MKIPDAKDITPLSIIALFLALTEVALTVAATQTSGTTQLMLVVFVIVFPLIISILFFLVLWQRPYVFYSPKEYDGGTKVKDYISALHTATMDKIDLPIESRSLIDTTPLSNSLALPEKETKDNNSSDSEKVFFELLEKKEYKQARELKLKDLNKAKDDEEKAKIKSLAAVALSEYDFRSATKEFDSIKNDFKKYPFPHLAHAFICYDKKQLANAVKILDEGLKVLTGIDRMSLVPHKVEILLEMGDLGQAEIVANEYINIEWDDKDEQNNIQAFGYRTIGEIRLKQNKKDEAITSYITAYKKSPLNSTNLEIIASFFRKINDSKMELFFCKHLYNLDPENKENITYLAGCYKAENLYDLAFEFYKKAYNASEDKQTWIISNTGNLYKEIGLYSEAVSKFQETLNLDSKNEYALKRFSECLELKQNEEAKADQIFQKVEADLNK